MDPWTLPLTLQVGLATGYLAYVTAYASKRRHHTIVDATFLSFAFGIPAVAMQTGMPVGALQFVVTAVALNVGLAVLWRQWGTQGWAWLMRKGSIHADDGMTDAWETVLSTPNLVVGQLSVHISDGGVLYLSDNSKYTEAPETGLLLGTNGSILMIVEEEELPDGSTTQAAGIQDSVWGTRMTYIPANQIVRINIRY